MTASRLDPRARARLLIAPLAVTLLAACRGGLPPEPPGADPADPNAAVVPYQVQANPYEVSAFAGEQPATGDPHAGHGNMNHEAAPDPHAGHGNMNHGAAVDPHAGHGQMDHGSDAASKPAPAPAKPTGHEQMDHGASGEPKQTAKPAAPTGKPAPAPAPSQGPTGHEMHKQAEQSR